jgi:hypothetical protein
MSKAVPNHQGDAGKDAGTPTQFNELLASGSVGSPCRRLKASPWSRACEAFEVSTRQPREVPSPALVAAWERLGLQRPELVPMWAAWWLADGFDGIGLRELAGLSGHDPRDVHDLLPAALADIGVALPSELDACAVALDALANEVLAGTRTELDAVEVIERIVDSMWPSREILKEPLGSIYGIDDEWGTGWGRTIPELRAAVQDACRRQVDRNDP